MKKALSFVGYILIILGIIALFAPFLHEILLILVGLLVISIFSDSLADSIEHFLSKFPSIKSVYVKVRKKLNSIFS